MQLLIQRILLRLAVALPLVCAAASVDVVKGWNLLGNSGSSALNVTTGLNDPNTVLSVWTWKRTAGKWAFYTPSMTPVELADYAQLRGYDVLSRIASKEGYWVNTIVAGTLTVSTEEPPQVGNPSLPLSESDLLVGWNLAAFDDGKTPAQLNAFLSPSLKAAQKSILTLWAWDAAAARWKFYAPALDAQGGTVLSNFLTSKSYAAFENVIGANEGFWVNVMPGATTTTTSTSTTSVVPTTSTTTTIAPTTTAAPTTTTTTIAPAINGEALYNNTSLTGSVGCVTCHTATPSSNINKILEGANSASTIQNAINSGTGGMGAFIGKFTPQQLRDIATYLAAFGDDDDDDDDDVIPTITGVAATGLAISGGNVTLKCVSGSATATTLTNGSYTLQASGLTLPCLVRVDYKDATGTQQKLHSLANAYGNTNITPITDLIVANLNNGDAAAAFDEGLTSASVSKYARASVSLAVSNVKNYLTTLGVTKNIPENPIVATLVAKSASHDGDSHDKVLDDLKDKLGTRTIADEGTEVTKGTKTTTASPTTTTTAAPTTTTTTTTTTLAPAIPAINGKALYNNKSLATFFSCASASCHTAKPSSNINKVLKGANSASTIQKAINSGTGGMDVYIGKITTQQLNDIAAYLATPNI